MSAVEDNLDEARKNMDAKTRWRIFLYLVSLAVDEPNFTETFVLLDVVNELPSMSDEANLPAPTYLSQDERLAIDEVVQNLVNYYEKPSDVYSLKEFRNNDLDESVSSAALKAIRVMQSHGMPALRKSG